MSDHVRVMSHCQTLVCSMQACDVVDVRKLTSLLFTEAIGWTISPSGTLMLPNRSLEQGTVYMVALMYRGLQHPKPKHHLWNTIEIHVSTKSDQVGLMGYVQCTYSGMSIIQTNLERVLIHITE